MTKVTGALLLLCACGGLGLGAVYGLRERVNQLRGFLMALEEMERELRCRLTPMPQLLKALGERLEGPVGGFFALCAGGLDRLSGRPFAQLWQDALEASGLTLEEEDLRVLRELGSSLGRYDGKSQRMALEQARDRLEENLAQAVERRERLGRVYGALSLAAGAFLIIVLF